MMRFCVIGYPVKHSLSPRIHNRAFRRLHIDAHYEAISVKPRDLGSFIRRFRKIFTGGNVTIPHKERVIKFLDALSPEARKIGAVNCIVNRGGKLVGYNTDAYGAMEALKKIKDQRSKIKMKNQNEKMDLNGKKVVVLGAGGAARAVVYGLKKAGAKVTILNRTLSRAKKLAKEFKCDYMSLRSFFCHCEPRRKLGRSNPTFDILINTTSVGMWPHVEVTPLPSTTYKLHPLVFDIIYRPRLTKLLRDAKRAGCKIITGDKMFLAQAEKSFELWTGKKFLFLQKL